MAKKELYEYVISGTDGSRSGVKIMAASKAEAIAKFEKKTKQKAVHVACNPFNP